VAQSTTAPISVALPPRRLREDLYGSHSQKALPRTLLEGPEIRGLLVRLAEWVKVRPCQSRKIN